MLLICLGTLLIRWPQSNLVVTKLHWSSTQMLSNVVLSHAQIPGFGWARQESLPIGIVGMTIARGRRSGVGLYALVL